MANASWPASLPQRVLVTGYQETRPDMMLRTTMEAGLDKVRRRYTAAPTLLQMSVMLDTDGLRTFRNFFDSTLAGGVLPFDWVDPVTQEAATFRFRAPPSITARSPVHFVASMDLEKLP